MNFRAPKGTYDIFPPASRTWRRLFRVWDGITERYGYDLVLTPIFEATEVFTRGVGQSSEVVQKQMYTFEDKAGRSLTLRPEQTASIVRAYIETGSQGVLKAAYWGPQFRYERPQKGRNRQFYQLGVEYIGEDAPEADAEVVELGYRFFAEAGLSDLEVQLNSIGGPESRAQYRDVLVAYLEGRIDELSDDSRRNLTMNPMRVLDSKVDAPKLVDAPAPVDYLTGSDREHFGAVRARLERLGIPTTPAPRLVRGLDYYTRTVFEYVPRSYEAAQSSVGGGGRYDGLTEMLGGPPTPGVGLSLGLDRLLLALGEPAVAAPLDAFVVVADDARWEDAFDWVAALRSGGLRVDCDVRRRSVKAQFKAADRSGAKAAFVVGAEWNDGKVTARDLRAGTQVMVDIEEAAEWAKRH